MPLTDVIPNLNVLTLLSSPSPGGNVPLKELNPTSRYVRSVSCPRSGGNVPLTEVYARSRLDSDVHVLIVVGIVPDVSV